MLRWMAVKTGSLFSGSGSIIAENLVFCIKGSIICMAAIVLFAFSVSFSCAFYEKFMP
jgi:hypothetical protein